MGTLSLMKTIQCSIGCSTALYYYYNGNASGTLLRRPKSCEFISTNQYSTGFKSCAIMQTAQYSTALYCYYNANESCPRLRNAFSSPPISDHQASKPAQDCQSICLSIFFCRWSKQLPNKTRLKMYRT